MRLSEIIRNVYIVWIIKITYNKSLYMSFMAIFGKNFMIDQKKTIIKMENNFLQNFPICNGQKDCRGLGPFTFH